MPLNEKQEDASGGRNKRTLTWRNQTCVTNEVVVKRSSANDMSALLRSEKNTIV